MDEQKGIPERASQGPEETQGETPDQATLHQDPYRKVLLGQVSDPIFPPHPAPPEAPEDELERQAIEDPDADARDASKPIPVFWRVLLLVIVALAALAIVFWRWR
jgi:hypothetical protein